MPRVRRERLDDEGEGAAAFGSVKGDLGLVPLAAATSEFLLYRRIAAVYALLARSDPAQMRETAACLVFGGRHGGSAPASTAPTPTVPV